MIAVCHLKLVEGRSAMIDLEARSLRKKSWRFLEALALVCVELFDLGPGYSNRSSFKVAYIVLPSASEDWMTLSRAVLAVLVQGLSATNGGWILHLQWRQKQHTTATAQYNIRIDYASSHALSIPPPTAVPSQFSRDLSAMIIPMPAMGPMCSSQQHLSLAKVQNSQIC